ncbi:MAG: acetolactate synthase 3 large subunit [Alphaproteobacteria bacterium]
MAPSMTPTQTEARSGADTILKCLIDQGVEVVFGYPGGAVLPIYDAIFKQNHIRHILVRHEQAAVHAAEGYARSTGKIGVVLVTSGPGATNAVTGLTDALMDSIPILCMTGQVPTHLIGNDAFQEADTVGITRPCTKHNYLVSDVDKLAQTMHEAFYVAKTGRPGPVVIDLPKDVQQNPTEVYVDPSEIKHRTYNPQTTPVDAKIEAIYELLVSAKKPIIYAGGGVINSGPAASDALRKLAKLTGFPVTNTLMGLGSFPASNKQFLGMLGMHGTYEANWAMHDCDVMLNVGARFDDRITGKLDEFAPYSKKIHIDIDPSSINKTVMVDLPVIGDCQKVLDAVNALWEKRKPKQDATALADWWKQIEEWRAVDCLKYEQDPDGEIRPQHAIRRLNDLTKHRDDVFITTEVGQHQMWAAQYIDFEQPNHWMTSGGLGTMGYGLPAAVGTQVANPGALVVDVSGEASALMNIQELATICQYRLPVKMFIINNQWMGMVRQWQELLHGKRYSESYSDSLPDFVKLAEAFGGKGIRCTDVKDLDACLQEMIDHDGPVVFDCCVTQDENCFPMIPSGRAHNQMLLTKDDKIDEAISGAGLNLV